MPSTTSYPGRITYFWANDAGTSFDDNRLAWSTVARGGFDLHRVPGDHATMREEPHIAVIADRLQSMLRDVQK